MSSSSNSTYSLPLKRPYLIMSVRIVLRVVSDVWGAREYSHNCYKHGNVALEASERLINEGKATLFRNFVTRDIIRHVLKDVRSCYQTY